MIGTPTARSSNLAVRSPHLSGFLTLILGAGTLPAEMRHVFNHGPIAHHIGERPLTPPARRRAVSRELRRDDRVRRERWRPHERPRVRGHPLPHDARGPQVLPGLR